MDRRGWYIRGECSVEAELIRNKTYPFRSHPLVIDALEFRNVNHSTVYTGLYNEICQRSTRYKGGAGGGRKNNSSRFVCYARCLQSGVFFYHFSILLLFYPSRRKRESKFHARTISPPPLLNFAFKIILLFRGQLNRGRINVDQKYPSFQFSPIFIFAQRPTY